MLGFIAIRGLQCLAVLLGVSFVSYVLIGLMPGDPIDLMFSADPDMTSEDAARLRELYGLDRPLLERYTAWLLGALQGEFGYSRLLQQPVGDVLLPRLWATIQLLGLSTALSILVAVPLGALAAAKPNGILDRVVNFACFAGISIPSFWLALLLITYIAVPISWIPASGSPDPGASLWDHFRHLLLPILGLTIASVGGYTRFLRASMRQTLNEDFIRTARAKGAAKRDILFGHALRNAMLPLVTIVALSFGSVFSGALIIETIFGLLGMGRTIYTAIMGNDFNLALICLMVATAFTLIANILADIVYALLDPRIQLTDHRAN